MRRAHLWVSLRHLVNKVMKKLADGVGFLSRNIGGCAKVIRILMENAGSELNNRRMFRGCLLDEMSRNVIVQSTMTQTRVQCFLG